MLKPSTLHWTSEQRIGAKRAATLDKMISHLFSDCEFSLQESGNFRWLGNFAFSKTWPPGSGCTLSSPHILSDWWSFWEESPGISYPQFSLLLGFDQLDTETLFATTIPVCGRLLDCFFSDVPGLFGYKAGLWSIIHVTVIASLANQRLLLLLGPG